MPKQVVHLGPEVSQVDLANQKTSTGVKHPGCTITAYLFNGIARWNGTRPSRAEASKVASWLMNNDERCYNYLDASIKTFH